MIHIMLGQEQLDKMFFFHLCVENFADIYADVEADRLVPQQKSKFSVLKPENFSEIRETSLA